MAHVYTREEWATHVAGNRYAEHMPYPDKVRTCAACEEPFSAYVAERYCAPCHPEYVPNEKHRVVMPEGCNGACEPCMRGCGPDPAELARAMAVEAAGGYRLQR